MASNSCTLLINSCDSYVDILEPFFKLLNKYWKDLPYDIVLSTESTNYKNKYFKIKNIHPDNPNCSWTERITDVLKKISSDYVILMLDDFFLYDYVNSNKINDCLNWLKQDEKIATFTFWPVYSDSKNCMYDGFAKRSSVSNSKVAAIAGIWNKKQLLKYTEGYKENIWEWEINATKRSNTLYKKDEFYIMLNDQSQIFPYDLTKYGLFSGKWLKATKEIFDDNNIKFDFSKRGFYNEWERALSQSIISSFEMESAIIANYELEHKGSSYKLYDKKFKPGNFSQTYEVTGARDVICWEPSILWGFAINNLEVSVTYKDKSNEIIDLGLAFGSFLNKDGTFFFNGECPTMYIPTKPGKILKKINISGNLFLPSDSKLLKLSYRKKTIPKSDYYKELERKINLEKIISKEKVIHICIKPEIKFLDSKDKLIKSFVDNRVFKKGAFRYEYELIKNASYMLWSPSLSAGYKIKSLRIYCVLNNQKKKRVKNISGIPKNNIFIDKEWIKVPLKSENEKIIITGKCLYPIKNSDLKKVI